MSTLDHHEDEEEVGFLAANKLWISLVAVAAIGSGGWFWFSKKEDKPAPPKQDRVVMVSLPPPPPPPPKPKPTPPPVQQPEQKVEDKKTVMDDSPKPDAAKPEPPKPASEPPPSMGSNIKGDGPDSFGLSGSGNGGFVGLGGNGNGKGGNGYGPYASKLKSRVLETLRRDKRTRTATFGAVKVKVWVDETGRVTRAEPAAGDDSASAAATLLGLQGEPPPNGIPMPLTVSLAARRP